MPKNYSQLTMSHPRTFLLGIQNKSSEAFQWIFNFERSDFRMKNHRIPGIPFIMKMHQHLKHKML